MLKITAILLAAGLSQRMGRDKLLLNYNGKSLLQIAIELLSELPVHERIIITTDARSEHITLPPGIRLCINKTPETGQSESIKLGIERTQGDGSNAYLFLNADQPLLTVNDVSQIIATVDAHSEKIIYPLINNKPNSPTIFPAHFRPQLLKLSADEGGRVVRNNNHEHCLAIAPNNPCNFIDIDNEEDYHDLINC